VIDPDTGHADVVEIYRQASSVATREALKKLGKALNSAAVRGLVGEFRTGDHGSDLGFWCAARDSNPEPAD
jgi:hypothetical protein